VRYSYKESIYISSLPSLQELERQRSIAHVQHWINVSGIDIHQIYPEPNLLAYTISQFDFADVFTDGKKLTDFSKLEQFDTKQYKNVSELKHRNALLTAVKMLITQLENESSTSIFCHRGLARSPLVAASALNFVHDEALADSIARVHLIHRPAYFTDISISALLWCKEQLRKPAYTE
jgi:predicted protein tyrosine phosphatase